MVLVHNSDRHLEKFLKDNGYSYDEKKKRKERTKKEFTPEQQVALKERMAKIRAMRKPKNAPVKIGNENDDLEIPEVEQKQIKKPVVKKTKKIE